MPIGWSGASPPTQESLKTTPRGLVAFVQRPLSLDGGGIRRQGTGLREDGWRGPCADETRAAAPIAHASEEGDPPPRPETFKHVRNRQDLIRPDHGTWCSPVTAWSAEGAPTATNWTVFCATPDELGLLSGHHGKYTQFSRVEPLPCARIYLIDTTEDLDRLVEAFPLPPEHRMYRVTPDWEAMAASSWDAVYASEAGITANAGRLPIGGASLAQWDCSSVLFLRPAYRLTTP